MSKILIGQRRVVTEHLSLRLFACPIVATLLICGLPGWHAAAAAQSPFPTQPHIRQSASVNNPSGAVRKDSLAYRTPSTSSSASVDTATRSQAMMQPTQFKTSSDADRTNDHESDWVDRSEIKHDGRFETDSGSKMIALPPRHMKAEPAAAKNFLAVPTLGKTAVWLGVVIGLFFSVVWISRKSGGKRRIAGSIPGEVVQVLGRLPLDQRQQMQLVRLGDKIILLAASTTGVEPLSEITDRDEVDAITEICLSKNPQLLKETFRQTIARVRDSRRAA
jgi:flagellar biogenesis protein FliO